MCLISTVLLAFSYGNAFASATDTFRNTTSIEIFLKNQSRMAQENFSKFSPKPLNVGNLTIKTMKQSHHMPRMSNDEINLIFHQNGSITYAVRGINKPLLTFRAGEFQIDPEIFNLVFPGLSMDTKGKPGSNNGTTEKNMEELKQTTTTTLKPKTNPPKKGTKSSATVKTCSIFIMFLLVACFSYL